MLKPTHTLSLALMLIILPVIALAQDFYRAGEKVVPEMVQEIPVEVMEEQEPEVNVFEEEGAEVFEDAEGVEEGVEVIEGAEVLEGAEDAEGAEEEVLKPAAPETSGIMDLMGQMKYLIIFVGIVIAAGIYWLSSRSPKPKAVPETVTTQSPSKAEDSSARLEQALDALEKQE